MNAGGIDRQIFADRVLCSGGQSAAVSRTAVAFLSNESVLYGLLLWMADLPGRRLDRRSVQCAA